MGSREELHEELKVFSDNVYFQPPSSIQMKYPCIVYNKDDNHKQHGNNSIYYRKQGYTITVMDRDPDSLTPEMLESYFQYCSINQYYEVDGLHHTTLNLYY